VEAGHHRLETRQVFAVPVSHYHRCIAKVSGGINHRGHGQAAATWNKTTTEVCFYIISSLAAAAAAQPGDSFPLEY